MAEKQKAEIQAGLARENEKKARWADVLLENMTDALAKQLSHQTYRFDPNFMELINRDVGEYRSADGYFERAKNLRQTIGSTFFAAGDANPSIGFIIVMSQSKFNDKSPGGLWGLPSLVVKDVIKDKPRCSDETTINMADPKASTCIAAKYIEDLLKLFGRANFMYAVACYGMPLDEAGKIRDNLENQDPGRQWRYDLWKMKEDGVVSGEQVERVARFFAAGIVIENPATFGLQNKPMSSLWSL